MVRADPPGRRHPELAQVRARAGAALALAGIALVALNLRPAVVSLSPLIDQVQQSFPIGSIGLGLLGTLAPACFALAGLSVQLLDRVMSTERLLLLALLAIVVGQVARALGGDLAVLTAGSALAFVGMGIANVLLPALVKRYFPRRIGSVTGLYVTLTAVGAFIPPLLAIPFADSFGWRGSVASWSGLAAIAAIPWVVTLARKPAARVHQPATDERQPAPKQRAWRSRVAWSLALMFGTSSFNGYAMFAWLPVLLIATSDVEAGDAALLLSLFAIMGFPAAILVPLIAARMRDPFALSYIGAALFIIGYLGLIVVPAVWPIAWVAAIGLGTLLFPLSLLLVNVRTITHRGAVALSGFVQGVGYLLGACGPFVFGLIHETTRSWSAPLLVLLLATVATTVASRTLMTTDHFDNPKDSPASKGAARATSAPLTRALPNNRSL